MNPSETMETARTPEELPGVVTRLFRGVLYAESDEKAWQSLLTLESQARDYVAVLGLDLILDESEGYAFLRSREDPEGNLPRLIPRRRLTFDVSLLLALLRGRMLEFDTNSSELRLIMTEQDILDMVAVSCLSPATRPRSWTSWAPPSKRWWTSASSAGSAARRTPTRSPGS